jgi:hypothetical protein
VVQAMTQLVENEQAELVTPAGAPRLPGEVQQLPAAQAADEARHRAGLLAAPNGSRRRSPADEAAELSALHTRNFM